MSDRIAGIVLAGGLATRMGGGDKALLRIAPDRCLLDVVLARLAPQCEVIALNANGDPSRFGKYNLPVLADTVTGYLGPLAGILAGMDWAADQGYEAVLSVAADTPFFPADLSDRLTQGNSPSGLVLAASADESGKIWRQPTFGLWPVNLREDLRKALVEKEIRKIVVWTERHDAGQVVFDAAEIDPFFNVNTPEDLERAKSIYQSMENL